MTEPTSTPGHVDGTSVDERAALLMGRRDDTGPIGIVLFEPIEQGYKCPIHQRSFVQEEQELTLHWSEYNAFLWCALCDRDIPSTLCCNGFSAEDDQVLARAIGVYLDSVEQAVAQTAEAVSQSSARS